MIVFIHVCCAIASLASTSLLWLHRSKRVLTISYALVAATIVSGSYLVWSTPTHILQTCVSGLFYATFTLFGLATARHRLRTSI